MINPASISTFKTETLQLADRLGITPDVMIALGATMMTAHGAEVGLDATHLHDILAEAISETAAAQIKGGPANDR